MPSRRKTTAAERRTQKSTTPGEYRDELDSAATQETRSYTRDLQQIPLVLADPSTHGVRPDTSADPGEQEDW